MALVKCNKCGHLLDSNVSRCPICGAPSQKKINNENGTTNRYLFFLIVIIISVVLLLLPCIIQLPNVVWYTSTSGAKSHFNCDFEYHHHKSSFTVYDIPFGSKRVLVSSNDIFWLEGTSDIKSVILPRYATLYYDESPWWSNCKELGVVKNHQYYDYIPSYNAFIDSETKTLIGGCSTTTIPNYVTAIGSYAFSGSEELSIVTIPESVKAIASHAFADCKKLSTVNLNSNSDLIEIYNGAFIDCPSLSKIVIPENCILCHNEVFDNNLKYIIYLSKTPKNEWNRNNNNLQHIYANTNCTVIVPKGSKQRYIDAFHEEGLNNIHIKECSDLIIQQIVVGITSPEDLFPILQSTNDNMSYNDSTQVFEPFINETETNEFSVEDFIIDFYMNNKYEDYAFLEEHCSPSLLKWLKDGWDYADSEGYCVWEFRSGHDDGPSDRKEIVSITKDGDWYTYEAYDMGNLFTRKVKIVFEDGKIII